MPATVDAGDIAVTGLPEVPTRSDYHYVYGPTPKNSSAYLIQAVGGLALEHRFQGGVWTVSERRSGVFGVGSEPSEAIRDFSQALREHLDLLERQSALSEGLQSQLRILRSVVR